MATISAKKTIVYDKKTGKSIVVPIAEAGAYAVAKWAGDMTVSKPYKSKETVKVNVGSEQHKRFVDVEKPKEVVEEAKINFEKERAKARLPETIKGGFENKTIGTTRIEGNIKDYVPVILTKDEAYANKLINRTEWTEAKANETITGYEVPLSALENMKNEKVKESIAEEMAERTDTKVLNTLANEFWGFEAGVKAAVHMANGGMVGDRKWNEMRREDRKNFVKEAIDAEEKGKLQNWIRIKTAESMIAPTMMATGAGALGKAAQIGTEAAVWGMTGLQAAETIKDPSRENIIRTAIYMTPLAASRAARKIIGKSEKGEIKWTEPTKEQKKTNIRETIRKAIKREKVTEEQKTWLKELEKEMNRIEDRMFVEKTLKEFKKYEEWKSRPKWEKEIIRKNEIKERRNAEKIIKDYLRQREQVTRDQVIAKRQLDAIKRRNEKRWKKQIKDEFRERRLHKQPFEGEWGIDTGLKSLREMKRAREKEMSFDFWEWVKKKEREDIIERKRIERESRREWKEERKEIKEKGKIRRYNDYIRVRERLIEDKNRKIRKRLIRKDGGYIEMRERKRPKIRQWKPQEEPRGGIEITTRDGQKMMIRTETKRRPEMRKKQLQRMKQRAETEQILDKTIKGERKTITKGQQRYAYMLARQGKLKTIMINRRAYAITPISVLKPAEKMKEKEAQEILFVPIQSTGLTPTQKQSIAQMQEITEIPKEYTYTATKSKAEGKGINKRLPRDKKQKSKEKKKEKKGEIRITSIDDPLYRLSGKSKYSDIMNIIKKQRHGNVYI